MIVTTATASAAVILGPNGERVRLRCLARRSMLASACESFDHLRLSPGAHHTLAGQPEAETVLYVLRGSLLVGGTADGPDHLAVDGDLLLATRGRTLVLEAGPVGAEVLCLSLAAARRTTATRESLARRRSERRTRP
ncbi:MULTISPECIES: hypothetical protein [unclassified Streptomyces]|uniref:hypothetical protein n=1 Tax=Streptomycetaceae TaxID=2062 RepID=UPI002E79A145|nr:MULTISPECIES: hypothetical protein [unclassified Streptomyces]MED7949888.1 hypothetical protein [Streptomyces sp. BE303]MEE1823635.1 hypothetical protein [Streptomyces sp. BE20]